MHRAMREMSRTTNGVTYVTPASQAPEADGAATPVTGGMPEGPERWQLLVVAHMPAFFHIPGRGYSVHISLLWDCAGPDIPSSLKRSSHARTHPSPPGSHPWRSPPTRLGSISLPWPSPWPTCPTATWAPTQAIT